MTTPTVAAPTVRETHGIHEVVGEIRSPYINHDLDADGPRRPQVGHQGHRRAVDLHVRLRAHLHAGLVADRRGDELVAGGAHHLPRQLRRARADGAQRARRHQVRHPLPRLLPRRVRHPRRQRARRPPRPGGLRLVRHPGVDRRRGHLQDPRPLHPRVGTRCRPRSSASTCPSSPASCSSGASTCRHLQGHRVDPRPAQHQGPAAHRARPGPAPRLGLQARRRLRRRCSTSPRPSPPGSPRRASSGRSSSPRSPG